MRTEPVKQVSCHINTTHVRRTAVSGCIAYIVLLFLMFQKQASAVW